MIDVEGALNKVLARPGRSLGEDIFFSWRAGDISWEDCCVHQSSLVANTLDQYPPISYSEPHPLVLQYAHDRVNDRTEYDQSQARRLGSWFHKTIQDIDENTHNRSLLLWSREYLAKKSLTKEVAAIDRALDRFNLLWPPESAIQITLKCKARDADARERRGRAT